MAVRRNLRVKKNVLAGKIILLGVTGSVAAYKACYIASELTRKGAKVYTLMTEEALEFVRPLQFQALTGNFVSVDMFNPQEYGAVEHIRLADAADVLVIAPATANVIGKLASGIADDILTTTALAVKVPVIIAPAMNCNMYDNKIVRDNIKKLTGCGMKFVGPEKGYLACGYSGFGRMSEPGRIISEIEKQVISYKP